MIKVCLEKNNGYQWETGDGVSFKGYYQHSGDTAVYRSRKAIDELRMIKGIAELEQFLKDIDGIFAMVIHREDEALFAVDRARSMPLYYSTDGKVISDSSEKVRQVCGIACEDVDEYDLLALYTADYLTGNATVYTTIRQLDMGQAGCAAEGEVQTSRYYYHMSAVSPEGDEALKEKLSSVSERVFQRIKEAVGGRPVVLSMSGGYDSRYVACMLKLSGIEDVSCYTYGKQNSFEVKQSKKNAEALGYRWRCVEYTDDEVVKLLDDVGRGYLEACREHDYTTYIQNYTAVRKLSEDKWFKPNSVFITGLCGDMPTGEYVVPYDATKAYTAETAAEHLYSIIFTRFQPDAAFHDRWIRETLTVLQSYPIQVTDYQTWTSVVDCFYTGACHSRAYLNMNRIHEYYGYEWLLPYWDKELLDAWYSVPAERRYHQVLYEEWMLGSVASQFGLDAKKKIVLYPSNPLKNRIMYVCGSWLVWTALHLSVPFRRSYDFNNFAPLELRLYQGIKDKSLISYRKAGITHLLNQYLCQKRYGVDVMRRASKRLRKL